MSKHSFLYLVLSALVNASVGGCAGSPAAGLNRAGPPVLGTAACPRTLAVPARAQVAGGLLVVGDYHGTNEIPSFVGDVVCALAATGGETRVGLEIPKTEQGRIGVYLASDGESAAREQLVAGEFWTWRDGRSSTAMVSLLDRIRILMGRGARISVVAFDIAPTDPWAGREEALAHNLADDVAGHPGAVYVVQVGNLHARTVKGVPWDPEHRPMGLRLKDSGVQVLSLDFAAPPGKAWACSKPRECGINEIGGNRAAALRDSKSDSPIELFASFSEEGFDGIFKVSQPTAALPMVPDAGAH